MQPWPLVWRNWPKGRERGVARGIQVKWSLWKVLEPWFQHNSYQPPSSMQELHVTGAVVLDSMAVDICTITESGVLHASGVVGEAGGHRRGGHIRRPWGGGSPASL